jgi:hypothetical protein
MIEDLSSELLFRFLGELMSPQTSAVDSDFDIAMINARLSPPQRSKEYHETEETLAFPYQPELESKLRSVYFRLGPDDLEQIPLYVHEWMLERVPHGFIHEDVEAVEQLRTLFFLFPETAIRHSVVGLLVESDQNQRETRRPHGSPIGVLSGAIEEDKGLEPADRTEQILLVVDLLLDHIDLYPEAVERALSEVYRAHRGDNLRSHLVVWSELLAGTRARLIQNVLES